MTTSAPIACTLDRALLPQRVAEIAALARDGLQSVESTEGSAILRFRRDPVIRERLERIVAAESECCAFLDFTLDDDADATVLMVRPQAVAASNPWSASP